MNENDVIVAISAFERGLCAIGYNIPLGAGVTAAQEVFKCSRGEK